MELPTTSFELTSIAAATSLHARQDSHCQLNTVYDPFTADIKSSMIKWTTDIVAVITFLNTALSITDLLYSNHEADRVILNAKTEPYQLETLSNATNIDRFATAALNRAVSDLKVIYGKLLAGLRLSVPSEEPPWMANHCILFCKQHVLAMRQVELAQSFLGFLESVPSIHLRTEGEHCVEKTRRVGSILLEVAHSTDRETIKSQATQITQRAMRLVDMLAQLDSKILDLIQIY